MQIGITSADRKLMWFTAGLFVLLTIVAIFSAPTPESEASTIPSTYVSTAGGARAAFLLLQRLGINAQRWEEPPFRLNSFSASQTVAVFAEPVGKPSHAERAALNQFVERGGRVLFCGRNFPDFFPEINPEKIDPDTWAANHGAGQIVHWRTAAPLTNENIESHLPLFLNSIGVDSRKSVLWDEYFHGERGSLWDYMGRVPAIRWASLTVAFLSGATLFTFSRRRGPVIPTPRVSRLSPLEFIDSLGMLYRKAKATGLPVEINARELRLQLLRKLALPRDIADEDLAHAASIRLGWNGSELLNAFAQSRNASFTPAQALTLVQSLKRFTANLAR